ncbi:MAG TPA: COX aromatic rich motif-containing protein [Candidatus Saccharimonadales bacterium]|jgi:cytochrome o ubiquinol oxidase subunit 2|nr:COX aromatic rich motif-containing protein [Candidatus Saccharimonadales bacterium]
MQKHRKSSTGIIVWRIVLGLASLTVMIAAMMHGNNVALFDSKGMIAHEQRGLMIVVVAILLVIAIPALFLIYFIAWKYRESNAKVKRSSKARNNRMLVSNIWLIPSIFALVLAMIMWPAAHKLDPKHAIAADAKPITIQVVSMRWKWVFIYPEQHIATVNFVQIPEHTPVTFMLTADEAPMSSFWIPNLGGQLYSMTGHLNQLNLVGDTQGDYVGSSAEINGAGFADMKFTTRVSPKLAFDFWVNQVKLSGKTLNEAEYQQLLKPSQNNPAALYAAVDNNLYDKVLMKYVASMGDHAHMMDMGKQE